LEKQGFQAKLLSSILRISLDAEKERTTGYIFLRSPASQVFAHRKEFRMFHMLVPLDGLSCTESALKEVLHNGKCVLSQQIKK
jgi:hypothetical protein